MLLRESVRLGMCVCRGGLNDRVLCGFHTPCIDEVGGVASHTDRTLSVFLSLFVDLSVSPFIHLQLSLNLLTKRAFKHIHVSP